MVQYKSSNGSPTLKELIRAAGYSQIGFCEKVGISTSSLRYYNNCEKEPTLGVFLKMCEVLNLSPRQLPHH
ncbi:MAG: helix-turn-helix transcriptional regulator [Limnothrix sp. RL_2_0]|nr:helix-turn-helix transcriptional regulator [Limnothrix sp. RL_2_0]